MLATAVEKRRRDIIVRENGKKGRNDYLKY